MSIRFLSRCAMGLAATAVIAGCSSNDRLGSEAAEVSLQCKLSPSSCLYKGAYEPGERAYAEQEAARLNEEQVERLRHLGR